MIPSSWNPLSWPRLVAQELNPILTQFTKDAAKLEYDGNASKVLRVNATEDGVELATISTVFGYETGDGGTVTQLTSKSTGVTLNKACGEITMHNASLGSGSSVSFTLTNSTIAAGDLLVMNHVSGGTIGRYAFTASCASGSASITVSNLYTGLGGSLSEAVVIRFAVVKAATS